MAKSNRFSPNMSVGEISPYMHSRSDLPAGQRGLERLENFISRPQGAVTRRCGTKFVNYTRQNKIARLIPFKFSDTQAYIIEATDQKFRFYKDEAVICESNKTITAIDDDGVITSVAHGYSDGDEVFIDSVVGPSEINGQFYLVANKTTDTFTLTDVFGNDIIFADFPAYVSGGTAARVYEITTPYLEADLFDLQYAQNADTMYVVHRSYAPRKVTRSGHTSWTCSTYVRTADPFGSAGNYPGSVCFLSSGRLLMAATDNSPETVWGSRSPQSGSTDYDDFTVGTTPTHGFKYTLAATANGAVDAIQWIGETAKFIMAGCYDSSRLIYGNGTSEAVTPLAFQAKPINGAGAARVLPVIRGSDCFYVQRNRQQLRSLDYDFTQDGYDTPDRNLISEHLTVPQMKQIVMVTGQPDILWSVLDNGRLIAMTYNKKEDIQAWHRHYLGGTHTDTANLTRAWGKVLSIGIMSRASGFEQLWVVVQRIINDNTVRTVEFISDHATFPLRDDFVTEVTDDDDPVEIELVDDETYKNVLYEAAKEECHVDMALNFDATSTDDITDITVLPSGGALFGTELSDFGQLGAFITANPLREVHLLNSRGDHKVFPGVVTDADQIALTELPNNAGTAVDRTRGIAYIAGSRFEFGVGYHLQIEAISTVTDRSGIDETDFYFTDGVVKEYEGYGQSSGSKQLRQTMALSSDGRYLYVIAYDDPDVDSVTTWRILKIDTNTGNLVGVTQQLDEATSGGFPGGLSISADDKRLYLCAELYLYEIDTYGMSITFSYAASGGYEFQQGSLSPDGLTYVGLLSKATNDKTALYFLNTVTKAVTAVTYTSTYSSFLGAVTWDRDNSHVWIADPDVLYGGIQKHAQDGSLVSSITIHELGAHETSAQIYEMITEPNTGFIFGTMGVNKNVPAINTEIAYLFCVNPNTGDLLAKIIIDRATTVYERRSCGWTLGAN